MIPSQPIQAMCWRFLISCLATLVLAGHPGPIAR